MAEVGSISSASSATAPVDSHPAPSTSGSDNIKQAESRPENTTFGSMQRVPTRHEDLDFFDKEGHQQLARKISRQQSRDSTRTQDPTSDEFDFKQHLRHVLNKGDKEGIKVCRHSNHSRAPIGGRGRQIWDASSSAEMTASGTPAHHRRTTHLSG